MCAADMATPEPTTPPPLEESTDRLIADLNEYARQNRAATSLAADAIMHIEAWRDVALRAFDRSTGTYRR